MTVNKDLFGNEIIENPLLRERFIEPPFSVLDTKTGEWQGRKKLWLGIGVKSEIGRENAKTYNTAKWIKEKGLHGLNSNTPNTFIESNGTSIFDPALTELMYYWFCPQNGFILDPFAGGSVRGIIANYLGYKYTGIELRKEQVESNIEQAKEILPVDNQPEWITGDSDKILDTLNLEFDFIFSCPPYLNLEVYSDLPDDLSNMNFKDFMKKYDSIIDKALRLLKTGGYACFVVGGRKG